MRPMTRLFLGLAVLVGILAAVSVGLPAHVTVARSVVINAPESAVFPYLSNLQHFHDWSPWAARDPQLQLTYSGPESGKGAHVDWVSQVRSIGTGSMEITSADPNKTLELAVNFNGLDGTSTYDIVAVRLRQQGDLELRLRFRLEPAQALEGAGARWIHRG